MLPKYMESTLNTKNVPKSSTEYCCTLCDYSTSRKSQYDRHIITRKHELKQNEPKKEPLNTNIFVCNLCNKVFNSRTTLWRHSKECNVRNNNNNNNNNNNSYSERAILVFF